MLMREKTDTLLRFSKWLLVSLVVRKRAFIVPLRGISVQEDIFV